MRKWRILSMILMLLLTLSACSPAPARVEKTAFYFDTAVSITLHGGEADWIDEAFELCEKYEKIFSRTDAESELYRLNHTGAPATVGDELAQVIGTAVEYSALSGGKFDVTVASFADLWDFTAEHPALPDADALQAAGERVGYEKIEIDSNTVTLHDGAQIDLGGIAKGYIADRLAEFFIEKGANAVISLGGNIVLTGAKSDGAPYTVGIKDPENPAELAAKIKVGGGWSVVTSGDYERCFELNGVRYHHILDAQTGMPADSDLRSATVIAQSSTKADALSTICFLLGADEARALIESMDGVEAVFIDRNNKITHTAGIGSTGEIQIEQ